ncbi:hypothetical protein [Burkholderia sp. BCC0322]|uniref:hypothetical protein n=1 Tax=unclassified Burkholderia TaxID=2613784 RepID=UPI00158B94DC|nr:hypothetical protein [Burkholderia sp. BCC0322]
MRRLSSSVKIEWQSMSVLAIDFEPGLNRDGSSVATSRAVQTEGAERDGFGDTER